jgi:protein-tyrosine phosphatase
MLRVLFVCTGNRCRSPFAAAVLNRAYSELARAESAGTLDLGPARPPSEAVQVATALGVELSGKARPLSSLDLTEFDVVMGFERNHVAAAVVEGGAAYERSFLLPELARLLAELPPSSEKGDPVHGARALLRLAHERRNGVFVPGEEITDPIGRPIEVYEEVYARIQELTLEVAERLVGREARQKAPPEQGPLNW